MDGMLALYTLLAGLLLLPLLLSRLFPYWLRDLGFIVRAMTKTLSLHRKVNGNPNFTFLETFLQRVREAPDKPFLVYGDEVYSYSDVDKLSSQAARALLKHSTLRPGGCAAVLMANCPAYVWLWFGLCKMGCSMACLNYNIRSNSLLHCFTRSGATVLIASADLIDAVKEIKTSLKEKNVQIFSMSNDCSTDGVESLLDKVNASSDQPLSDSLQSNVTYKSPALYIFTSGTTGLPKAVIINHRVILLTATMFELVGVTSKDIIYTSLPLYHASALMIGIHGCLHLGATCVLRSKFSASQFWDDCRKHRVTVIQYVGELLRYLCNGPQKPNDLEHNVRIAIGNGLRPEVWKEFLERFGPIQISEFYGFTEGNVGFLNYIGKIGAVGRVNIFQKMLAPYEFIKYNPEEDQPVRDKNGRCIKVPRGEVGLLISKITNNNRVKVYTGDKELTESKILRNVFSVGDRYFNSGDLLMFDQEGFIYFSDRVGDTFRWKGENVSTREVEAVLVQPEFIEEVTVYGVSLPGHEGRIGMASMQLKAGARFDGKRLYEHVRDYLPRYAAPYFIRIQDVIEVTGTYKQCKVQLMKEGFDLKVINDPLYFMDVKKACYVPMTQEIYDSIQLKRVKL